MPGSLGSSVGDTGRDLPDPLARYGDMSRGLSTRGPCCRQLMVAALLLCAPHVAPAGAAPPRILAFGDSLTAGYGLAAPTTLSGAAAGAGSHAAGIAARGHQWRRLRRHHAPAASRGSTGRSPTSPISCSSSSAPTTRCAASIPSVTYDNLDKILARIAQSRRQGAAPRHARAAQLGPRLSGSVRCDLSRARREIPRAALSLLSRRRGARRRAQPGATGCIPTRAASTSSSTRARAGDRRACSSKGSHETSANRR